MLDILKNDSDQNYAFGNARRGISCRGLADQKIQTIFPEIHLIYTQHLDTKRFSPSTGTGIEMLLDGQISFAHASRSIQKIEYERAALMGLKLKQIPVAIDGIAVVVHPSLDVPGLTLEQLKNIYTGQITNWSQVGGLDLKITVYSPPKNSGAPTILQEEFFSETQEFGGDIIWTKTPSEAIQKVGLPKKDSQDRGGIYLATATNLIGQCLVKPLPLSRQGESEFIPPYRDPLIPPEDCPKRRNKINYKAFTSGQYPLTRRLFVIVKQDGSFDQKAGEAYANFLLTPEGQKLIQEAGFIPIKSLF